MAEGSDNRTEAATPRRREEARERGQVARSVDLSAAVVLLTGLTALGIAGPSIVTTLLSFLRDQLNDMPLAGAIDLDGRTTAAVMVRTVALATGPLLAAVAIASLVANLTQVGFLWTTHPLTPALSKLSPVKGVGRLLSVRSLFQLFMNLFKLAVIVAVAWLVLRRRVGSLAMTIELGGWQQLAISARVTWELGLWIALAMFVLAILDYVWQRYRLERDLRMTKEEVKEEMRRMEGDPIVRQRRRQLQLRLVLQRLRRDVPKAQVVVTNPTELAIAIQYERDKMAAPRVVAKGQGYVAQRIREIAVEHGIPIVERKPLARALFKAVEVGQEIPETYYQAVAEILAYVYRLAQTRRRAARPSAA